MHAWLTKGTSFDVYGSEGYLDTKDQMTIHARWLYLLGFIDHFEAATDKDLREQLVEDKLNVTGIALTVNGLLSTTEQVGLSLVVNYTDNEILNWVQRAALKHYYSYTHMMLDHGCSVSSENPGKYYCAGTYQEHIKSNPGSDWSTLKRLAEKDIADIPATIHEITPSTDEPLDPNTI